MTNLEDMSPFKHRGVIYYEYNEHIFDGSNKLLGVISSRGPWYLWVAMRTDGSEFARGDGHWAEPNETPDPAMDALLNAHSARQDALEDRR